MRRSTRAKSYDDDGDGATFIFNALHFFFYVHFIMFHAARFTLLHYTTLQHTALRCTALHYTALRPDCRTCIFVHFITFFYGRGSQAGCPPPPPCTHRNLHFLLTTRRGASCSTLPRATFATCISCFLYFISALVRPLWRQPAQPRMFVASIFIPAGLLVLLLHGHQLHTSRARSVCVRGGGGGGGSRPGRGAREAPHPPAGWLPACPRDCIT